MISDAEQMEIEVLTDKNQLLPTIRAQFLSDEGINALLADVNYDLAIEVLTKLALYKRADPSMMLGLVWRKCQDVNSILSLMDKLIDLQLVTWDEVRSQFVTVFILSDDVKDKCDTFGYPLPMLVEPVKVMTNKQDGYLMNSSHNIMLNAVSHDDVNLEHINRVNSVKLKINKEIFLNMENHWTTESGENRANFERFNHYCKQTCQFLLDNGGEFYLTHKFDYRGRCYDVGYYVNSQGDDYQKSIIELSNKEVINNEEV